MSPTPANVTKARFLGVRNGRPRFDIGDNAPPKWLVELAESGEVRGSEFYVNGKPIKPGTYVGGGA